MHSATLDLVPSTRTAQQKGAYATPGGRIRFFTKPELRAVERSYGILLAAQRPREPLAGALHLWILFDFPYRKSETKARSAAGYQFHDSRPDLDNLEKLLIDAATAARWWSDDAKISVKCSAKRWTRSPAIHLAARAASEAWLVQAFPFPIHSQ